MMEIKDIMAEGKSFQPVIEKAERLVSAVYLVTGFMADKEPLKWKIRLMSSDLLKHALTITDTTSFGGEKIAVLQSRSVSISSFLRVAKNSGLISKMNSEILEREFGNFQRLIQRGVEEETGSISSSLEIRLPERLPEIKRAEPPVPIKDITPVRKELLEMPYRTKEYKEKTSVATPVSQKKNSRQSVILDLVKKKGEIMIKDVTPLIDGCSEKTIQRELLAMVQSGVLKKMGEKRWSKYSLVLNS